MQKIRSMHLLKSLNKTKNFQFRHNFVKLRNGIVKTKNVGNLVVFPVQTALFPVARRLKQKKSFIAFFFSGRGHNGTQHGGSLVFQLKPTMRRPSVDSNHSPFLRQSTIMTLHWVLGTVARFLGNSINSFFARKGLETDSKKKLTRVVVSLDRC